MVSRIIELLEPLSEADREHVLRIAALARVASGCTRLVDSIFASDAEHKSKRAAVVVGGGGKA